MIDKPPDKGAGMFVWLKRLFRRLFHLKEPLPAGIPIGELQWKSMRWHRRLMSHFRRAPTSHADGFLDMPKFQLCEDCGAWAKRRNKDKTGAYYRCRCALLFHVTHPAIKRQQLLQSRGRKKWPKKEKPLAASAAG